MMILKIIKNNYLKIMKKIIGNKTPKKNQT